MATNRPILPYARQSVSADDIQAVVEVLRSDWLTTGPNVERFERAFAEFIGIDHAVAVANGTAALHAAMSAAGIQAGDEVIVPAMTFVASANAALYQQATPVIVDVDPATLLIDPKSVEKKISARTKAIVAVDYAGQPCDYDALRRIAEPRGVKLIADACHSLGAEYKGRKVGSLADLTVFSFHPVKHITTGEGGMITTVDDEMAERLRRFRNHGINADHRERGEKDTWRYEMESLGYNYRLTDFQCALGQSQLYTLPERIARRREIARAYDHAFSGFARATPLGVAAEILHAYHLYVIRVFDRARVYDALRRRGIGVNVHYLPVHLHNYYRRTFGYGPGDCPAAEQAYEEILSLPMFSDMTIDDACRVIEVVAAEVEDHAA
ncbi:MAG TPA: UDP-4-amino-4,6-dideoxy-N-acetyl-beta-L-altrosamine transaminase [Verrucomicrobiae bacterium]|jgi:perosamine synthetase|nr:UDP-4-amino-4,6-dideoxy-N-acetyl-beta-L-altrosamine transaminase [Verrucomicrobiae bacterium]